MEDRFKIIHNFTEGNSSLAIDLFTGRIVLRKCLKIYDIDVYDILKNNRNIHVARIYEYYRYEDGSLVVYEEYIQGRTLSDILKYDKIYEKQAVSFIDDICDGLIFLHNASKPIVHHDLKPENIMVTDDGVVKIIDFDAAKIILPDKRRDTVLIGTPKYAAPEQYGFGASDEKTDIYALGCIIDEMLGDKEKYRKVIKKALNIEPRLRYANVKEMKAEFDYNIHSLWPLPGFRSGFVWKKATAIVIYTIFVMWMIILNISESSISPVSLNLMSVGIFLSGLDVYSEWTGLTSGMPGVRSKNIFLRFVTKTLIFVACIFFWLILGALVTYELE